MDSKEKEASPEIDKLIDDADEELTLKNILKRREALKTCIIVELYLCLDKKEQEYYKQKAYSSFGKNAIASLPTSPKYSIGKDQRRSLNYNPMTPGPMYSQEAGANIKYQSIPKWIIGTSQRSSLASSEKFEYFNHIYDERDDFSVLMKKWKKTQGGSVALERRMQPDIIEKTPGPGRYDPNFKPVVRKSPSCVLGIKLKDNILLNSTGTGPNVGPLTYKHDNIDKLARYHKFPIYSFQQAKRHDPGLRIWTKHESYWSYSCLGDQIMSHKSSSPLKSFGKETREDRNKCGVLKAMMQNIPASIRISMPKI